MICIQCKLEFKPLGKNHKICSLECRKKRYDINRRKFYCKDCNIQIDRGLRCKNCNEIKEHKRGKIRIQIKMNKAREVKQNLVNLLGGCQHCGYNKCLRALSFHHIDPKTKKFTLDTSNIMKKKYNDILLEVSKCLLLCQNCHAQLHQIERQKNISTKAQRRYKNKLDILKQFNSECLICKYKFNLNNIQCATFHHLRDKKYTLDSINLSKLNKDILQEELSKCVLLCSNCHMESEHYNIDLTSPSNI